MTSSEPTNLDYTATAPGTGRVWCCALLLVVVGVAVYANSFTGVMLFDDVPHIVDNQKIHTLWPIGDLLRTRRAVLNVSLAVNYAVHGLDVWGYHLVNVGVHLLVGLTLFGLVRRTLLTPHLRARFGCDATRLAFFTAMIWLAHPLCTQSVTYIVQRGEALMALFYLLVLYTLVRADTSARPRLWQALGVIACTLGMASKAVMVTAPVVALLYDRTFLSGGLVAAFRRHAAFHAGLVTSWGVLFALGIVQSTLNTDPNPYSHVGFSHTGVTPWQYAVSQPGVIVHYLRLAFWPVGLCLDDNWPVARTTIEIVPPAIGIGILVFVSFVGTIRRWSCGFLTAAFLLILAPTSSFVPIKDLAFEHRMYLPLAAVVVGATICFYLLITNARIVRNGRNRRARMLATMTGVVVVVLLGIGTIQRNRAYQSGETMWRDVAAKRPANYRAYVGIGAALQERGLIDEALVQYQRSLELKPGYADAWFDVGTAWQAKGDIERAIDAYERVTRLAPQRLNVYEILARQLSRIDRHNEAARWFARLTEREPENAKWAYELGNVLSDAGRDNEAIDAYRAAVGSDPSNARCWINLGNALRRTGALPESIKAYETATHIDPQSAIGWTNLGNVLGGANRTDEAIESFRRAIDIDASLAAAHIGLGRALKLRGRIEEARAAFEAALVLEPDSVPAKRGLAGVKSHIASPTTNE